MKYKCPICNNPLGYERLDDGMIINKITENNDGVVDIREIHNKSNGYEHVFCWDYKLLHIIPDNIKDDVLELIRNQ